MLSKENKIRKKRMIELKKEGKTYKEIGNIFDLSHQRVHQIINYKYQLKPRISKYGETIKLKGRDYIREVVRKRDEYICVICNKKWEEGTRRFDVHHVDEGSEKSKQYDGVDNIDDLITCCHRCHMVVLHKIDVINSIYASKRKHLIKRDDLGRFL